MSRNSAKRVAVVGGGPTAVYLLKNLLQRPGRFDITVYEAAAVAGCGIPYSEEHNSIDMMANITSIELPPVLTSLADWLRSAEAALLDHFDIDRSGIGERDFYPRVLLGRYFTEQLHRLQQAGRAAGHAIAVMTSTHVVDINPVRDKTWVTTADGRRQSFDAVILATGHRSELYETMNPGRSPSLFRSPYPTHDLSMGEDRSALILGSSLSGIDAAVALAVRYGKFVESGEGMRYLPSSGSPLRMVMASRKGLVPEADFFYPIPEEPLIIFTPARLADLRRSGKKGLLIRCMKLFRRQLEEDDPDFVQKLEIQRFTPQSFNSAYFRLRLLRKGFGAVEQDLARSKENYLRRHTVMWRYTLMRAHEVFSSVVPYLDRSDLDRFQRYMTPVFADAYGCIPHKSVERLLALHRANCLDVVGLEDRSEIVYSAGRFRLAFGNHEQSFSTMVDARGQDEASLSDLGFGRLQASLDTDDFLKRVGGEPDENQFLLPLKGQVTAKVFCLSIPLIMKRYPFAQGLFACSEAANAVAEAM